MRLIYIVIIIVLFFVGLKAIWIIHDIGNDAISTAKEDAAKVTKDIRKSYDDARNEK